MRELRSTALQVWRRGMVYSLLDPTFLFPAGYTSSSVETRNSERESHFFIWPPMVSWLSSLCNFSLSIHPIVKRLGVARWWSQQPCWWRNHLQAAPLGDSAQLLSDSQLGVSHHIHIHHFSVSTSAPSEQYPSHSAACLWDLLAQEVPIFP